MHRTAATTLALCGALGLWSGTAGAGEGSDDPRLQGAESFVFGIGNGMIQGSPAKVVERLGEYDVVVVDGEEASGPQVDALRDNGSVVLAYLSVGTIEKWRGWYGGVKRYRLAAWQDWKDEWFADVSKPGLRDVLTDEIAPDILAKRFDGLFLDNVDMIEPKGHVQQRAGMLELVSDLGELVHADDGLLFAQNGFWGLEKFGFLGSGTALDGWNREDVTWTYDFDHRRYVRNKAGHIEEALDELDKMRNMGFFTTATNYTKRSNGPAAEESIADACSVGALPFVGDIGLTAKRLPASPFTCPS